MWMVLAVTHSWVLVACAAHSPNTAGPPHPSTSAQLDSIPIAEYHRVLDTAATGDQVHDACIGLITAGDRTSVPHLIAALKLFPDVEPETLVCSWDHCVEALKRITGASPGYSYSAWKRWQGAHDADAVVGASARSAHEE
jgi:hypothetical protein